MSEDERLPNPPDPYAPPASILVLEPAADEGAEEDSLRTFVGSNANYYLGKWKLLDGAAHARGFNWAAFFLSGLWIGYRKMYTVAAVFFGIIMAETIAEEVLFVGVLGQPEAPAALTNLVNLVAAVVCGSYGNRWYLSHARRAIADVRTEETEEPAVSAALAKRGGTSVGAALVVLALFMAATFAVFTVLGMVLYPS